MVRVGREGELDFFACLLRCRTTCFPLIYLGVPLEARTKDSALWNPVIELYDKKLAKWKRNLLSKWGRLTLVKNTLSNIIIYYLTVLLILGKVASKLERIQCHFLWGDDDERRRYHLVN